MACLDDDTLLALGSGHLSGPSLELAEAHVDGCQRCRRALALGLQSSAGEAQRAPALSVGNTIGRFVVLERVGAGAMGQVFAAWDPQLDRKVALKLLKSAASSDEHQARLLREAQTLARLSHPNVVAVFDVGRWEGQRFIALEFVGGGSVRDWLEAQSRGAADVLDVFVQAGRGLAAAHQAGVVHRDFKPDNVLVRADGRAQVTDFGLASEALARLGDGPVLEHGVSLTGTGALLGTPAYMAPAQLDGEPATPASDQFAFCVALFEALTGQRPWRGSTVEAQRRAMRDGPPPSFPSSSEVPAPVRKAVLRGLSVQEASRWPSMVALLEALESGARPPRSSRVVVAGLALAVIAGLVSFSGRGRLPQACALGQARLSGVWSAPRRAQLEQAFLATKLAWAATAAADVARVFDERMAAWQQQHLEACLASDDARGDAELWRARLGCLEERVAELDATVGVLLAGGAPAVNKAARIVDRLPAATACLSPGVLERVPLDEPSQRVAREARQLAAQVGALYEAGAFDEAERRSNPRDAGVPPIVQSVVHYERGRVLHKLGRLDDAKATLKASALASTGLRDDGLAGEAWAELGFLVGFLQVKPEEALGYVELARAHLPAAKDSRLEEHVEGAIGNIETRRGRLDVAEAHFQRVLQLVEARTGPDSFFTARSLINLGNAKLRRGHLADALPLLERARASFERTLGAHHPDTFQALNSLGVALGEAGRLDESLVVFARVLEGYQATLGPTHPNVGTALFNVADAHLRLGHFGLALPFFERALEVWTKGLGVQSVQRVGALVGIAKAAAGGRDGARAQGALEAALGLCDAAECEPGDEGEAAWLLAVALSEAKRPWGAVEPLARRARRALGSLGEARAREVAQVDRFLASKGAAR
ncbi:MAG: serine/threonine protein kinase [Myxococcus sp.]|nr:serine/threonine protein kinase [Myxococcus sp.]